MKKILILISFILVSFLSVLNAQQFTLIPTYVLQNSMEANLVIYNNTSQPIHWSFPDTGWAALYVDGQYPGIIPLWIEIDVNIPVGGSHTEDIGYVGQQLSLGQHTLQAALEWEVNDQWTYIAVGDPVTVTLHNPYDFVTFSYMPDVVNQDLISVNFTITNHDIYNFWTYFDMTPQLRIDGGYVPSTHETVPSNLTILPDSVFSARFTYDPDAPISYGIHTITFAISGYTVLPTLEFNNIDPSGTDDQQTSPLSIKAYPNPFRNELNVSFYKEIPGDVSCDVFNIKGQKVYHKTISSKSGANEFTWNGCNLQNQQCPSGVYILQLKDGKKTETLRSIKN